MKRALITGITGQDGSWLAELLLGKGYEVHGLVRRAPIENPAAHLWRLRHLLDRLHLHSASWDAFASISQVVERVRPDECYHLAGPSFVSYSFDDPLSAMSSDFNGTHHVVAAILKLAPRCRFYFAGSSEMFGHPPSSPQDETTPFCPRSPYGISKLAAYHLVRNHRESQGLHACSGILFNHESERRGLEFVTRKISRQVARIKLGLDGQLALGNLDARRDWGYAPEYVHAMWLMLQRDEPEDYVIATGETHSVRELVAMAFDVVGLDWRRYVVVDPNLHRPAELHDLRGNAQRARDKLGWAPQIGLGEIVRIMIEADLRALGPS